MKGTQAFNMDFRTYPIAVSPTPDVTSNQIGNLRDKRKGTITAASPWPVVAEISAHTCTWSFVGATARACHATGPQGSGMQEVEPSFVPADITRDLKLGRSSFAPGSLPPACRSDASARSVCSEDARAMFDPCCDCFKSAKFYQHSQSWSSTTSCPSTALRSELIFILTYLLHATVALPQSCH